MTHNSNGGYDACANTGVFISGLLYCWIFFKTLSFLCSVTSYLPSWDVFVPDLPGEVQMPTQRWGSSERNKSEPWRRHCYSRELLPDVKEILSNVFCSQTKLADFYASYCVYKCCDSEAKLDVYTDIYQLTLLVAMFGLYCLQIRSKLLPWKDVAITFSGTSPQISDHQKYIESPENLVKKNRKIPLCLSSTVRSG